MFFYRPKLVPFYYLLWTTFLFFLLDLFVVVSYEEANYDLHKSSTLYIWLCCAMTLVNNPRKIWNSYKKLIITLFLFILYVLCLGLSRGTLMPFIKWIGEYFVFVPLWILMCNVKMDFKLYKNFVIIAFLVEIIIVLFQLVTGLYPSYTLGKFAENGTFNIVGTLKRYNEFADIMSLLLLSLFYIVSIKQIHFSKRVLYLVASIGVILIYMAGARTEFVAFILSMSIILYFQFKKWRILYIATVLIIVLLIGRDLTLKESNMKDPSNYNRQIELLDYFQGRSDVSEKSTLFLSSLLIDEYLQHQSQILTGPGLLFTSNYGYKGVVTKNYSMWDSFLALLLVETGIIGYLFLLTFLTFVIRLSKNKRYPMVMLLYLLIVSTTDYGLFQGFSAIYLLFVVYFSMGSGLLVCNGVERRNCNNCIGVKI